MLFWSTVVLVYIGLLYVLRKILLGTTRLSADTKNDIKKLMSFYALKYIFFDPTKGTTNAPIYRERLFALLVVAPFLVAEAIVVLLIKVFL